MTGASKLFASVLARRAPPRILGYAVLERLNRWFKTGNLRFHFERLYLETSDPWNFRNNAYETRKYERTLARILERRAGSDRVLEIGCSIGLFTKSLAAHFRDVVATDISQEALRHAGAHCREERNISFRRTELETLSVDGDFDVILCAEVLYYVTEPHAPAVCRTLKSHLRPHGIVVVVGAIAHGCRFWEAAMKAELKLLLNEPVQDGQTSYDIMIFQNA
jgi:2-polyprenyl-3-methyl-5-hydroxy-6-metoxy-1,4-benzoquinol methylase